jgi:hypothetical protein
VIEAAEGVLDFLGGAVKAGRICNVGKECPDGHRGLLGNKACRAHYLLILVNQGHAGTFPGEVQGDSAANPPGSADDHGCLAGKLEIQGKSFRLCVFSGPAEAAVTSQAGLRHRSQADPVLW